MSPPCPGTEQGAENPCKVLWLFCPITFATAAFEATPTYMQSLSLAAPPVPSHDARLGSFAGRSGHASAADIPLPGSCVSALASLGPSQSLRVRDAPALSVRQPTGIYSVCLYCYTSHLITTTQEVAATLPDPDNCLVSRARPFVIKVLHAAGVDGQARTGLFPFRYGPHLFLAQLEKGEPVSLTIVPLDDLDRLTASLREAATGSDYQSKQIEYVRNN